RSIERPPKSKCAAIPPGTRSASSTMTSCPALDACHAVASPMGPAPMTTTRLMNIVFVRNSKLQDHLGVGWVPEGLLKRLAERRRVDSKPAWPIDYREGLGDDERLELARGERRVCVQHRIDPKQPPEHLERNSDDHRPRADDLLDLPDDVDIVDLL